VRYYVLDDMVDPATTSLFRVAEAQVVRRTVLVVAKCAVKYRYPTSQPASPPNPTVCSAAMHLSH
jgi:hypothetical protein